MYRDQVTMDKISTKYYRGMAEPFLQEVLRDGLLPGHSITTSIPIAKEYGGKSAWNILHEGDPHTAITRRVGLRARVAKLVRLGIGRHQAEVSVPLGLKPRGSVIELNIPKSQESRLQGGLSGLGERVTTETVPPGSIRVLRRGIESPKGSFFASARKLSPREFRRSLTALKGERGAEVRKLLDARISVRPPMEGRLPFYRLARRRFLASIRKHAAYGGYPVTREIDKLNPGDSDLARSDSEQKARESHARFNSTPPKRRAKRQNNGELPHPSSRTFQSHSAPGDHNASRLDNYYVQGSSDIMGMIFKGATELRKKVTKNWCSNKDKDCLEGGELESNEGTATFPRGIQSKRQTMRTQQGSGW
jgi:hypothetical protein